MKIVVTDRHFEIPYKITLDGTIRFGYGEIIGDVHYFRSWGLGHGYDYNNDHDGNKLEQSPYMVFFR